jgi:hypothetical protein
MRINEIFISNITKDIEDGLIDKILPQVINEKRDLIIKKNNILYQLTSSFNQNINNDYQNISSINLRELEYLIKEKYNIPENDPLIIFKIEKNIEGLLIPLIEYEIFNPKTKEKLDIVNIENKNININIPVSINESIMYKYNINNTYYNDICNISFSEDEIDFILYDRINYYKNNNMSLCQNNCIYIDYNYINKNVICECVFQNGISLNEKKLLIEMNNIKRITNLEILKCYKILFSKEGLIKNIGSYIIILITIAYVMSAFFFYKIGFSYLNEEMKAILKDKYTEKNKKVIEVKNKGKKHIYQNLSNLKATTNNNIYTNLTDNLSIYDLNISKNVLNNNKIKNKIKHTDYEINSYSYIQAIDNDKRTYLQYYISLLKANHILIFTFCSNKDYNSFIIKICLFFFSIVLYLVINALLFNDSMFHKIYEDKGKFNIIYIIPRIIYTNIICSIINIIMKYIFLSQNDILQLKYEKNKYTSKYIMTLKCLIIKYICFFTSNILLFILFWYYLSCFCSVYKNSQIYLILNTIISFSFSLIISFIIFLIPGIFRIPTLNIPGKNFFKIGIFFQKFI